MEFDNKSLRLLDIYERLNKGEMLNKREVSEEYGVSEKSIQRDLEDLRVYIAEKFGNSDLLCYDRKKNVYSLLRSEPEYLTCKEITAVSKIILESRGFNKTELNTMLDKLILQSAPSDRSLIKDMISDERFSYIPLYHQTPLLDVIWEVSNYIKEQRVISFTYTRQDKKKMKRAAEPVAITFSEYYFYLIAYIENFKKEYPAVFRLDRCRSIEATERKFKIPHADKFNIGEFRNRIQFMYSGELMTVKFRFWGSSLEAVLDRFPTAVIVNKNSDGCVIKAEIFGTGVKMWFLSQAEFLEVLEPLSLREEMKQTALKMMKIYK